MNKLLSIFFLSALLLSSCSRSSDTTSPNTTTTPTAGTEQIVANIAGTDMTFHASAREALSGFDSLSIFGFDTIVGKNYKITLTMLNITKAGTYDIITHTIPTALPSIRVQYSYSDAGGGNAVLFDSQQSLDTKLGTLTYSSLVPLLVQGTFNATIPLSSGPTGTSATIVISNGSFKIVFA